MPRALLLAMLLAVAALSALAPSASATTLLTCPAAETAGYSPALTNTPQATTITSSSALGPCVNAAAPLELRTGTAGGTFGPLTRSCTDLLDSGGPVSRTIAWSTGTTSTFTYDVASSFIAGGAIQVVQDGTITAGEFSGKAAVSTITVASPGLAACSGAGVASFSGVGTLTIAG